MVRSWRIEYEGAFYHLLSRGNEQRDVLIYFIWKAGRLTNAKIGALFGVSYSSVSHGVKAAKTKLKKDTKLRAKFDTLNSQFKI